MAQIVPLVAFVAVTWVLIWTVLVIGRLFLAFGQGFLWGLKRSNADLEWWLAQSVVDDYEKMLFAQTAAALTIEIWLVFWLIS
jgi:hypothetical protein